MYIQYITNIVIILIHKGLEGKKMREPRILIFAVPENSREANKKMEQFGCKLKFGEARWHIPGGDNEVEMEDFSREADALVGTSIRSSPITRRVLEANPNLRVIAKCTVGTDDIDVEAATELGILVCHAPTESNCWGVAEGTVSMILTKLKQQRERDRAIKQGKWKNEEHYGTYLGQRLSDGYPGITLGLIGLGRIGARVAQLFAPWNFKILAHDPYIEDERFLRNGTIKTNMDRLLEKSDVVSLHCVNNAETRNLINDTSFKKMKSTALFVNTSRGKNVDEQALIHALQNDIIAGACLDAFWDEPIADDSPFRSMGDKVLLSGHMISYNHNSGLGPGYAWATDAVIQALAGEIPNNVFNPEVIERWTKRFGKKSILPTNTAPPNHPGYGPPQI